MMMLSKGASSSTRKEPLVPWLLLITPLLPLLTREAFFGKERLHRQRDVLGHRGQEAQLRAERLRECFLGQTEEEPLSTQLPSGQTLTRLPMGARGSQGDERNCASESRLTGSGRARRSLRLWRWRQIRTDDPSSRLRPPLPPRVRFPAEDQEVVSILCRRTTSYALLMRS